MFKKLLCILFFTASLSFAESDLTDNWFPLPSSNNFFLKNHEKYARLLWAFDYGHSLIYERLWKNTLAGDYDFSAIEGSTPDAEGTILAKVLGILANPPKQSPSEETLSPNFNNDFSQLMDIFKWTHKLHWVVYDIISAEKEVDAKKLLKQQIEEAFQRYPTLTVSTKCKSMMDFMEKFGKYSMSFRRNAKAANGLIWAYHYYQLAIYDGLMLPAGKQREDAISKVYKTFQKMAEDPANNVTQMPMARKVSPNFYKTYPELAAIFDNLHELHDVVGDILTDDTFLTTPEEKKKEMKRAINAIQDNTSYLIDCDKNGHDDKPAK
jgi:hypothetical protein